MSDAFALTEDQQLFRREWRRLFEDKFTERAAEIDKTGEFPWDNLKVLAEAGLTGINIPEAYGGAGADSVTHCILVEEVARVCASTSLIPAVNKLATLPVLFAATEEQQQRFLPPIADGSAMASYCLTEPGSGSDAAAMRTQAVRDGDDYILNGTKRFITGGGVSKLYVYYAVTDPDAGPKGISAFILEDSMPGFEIGKHEDKLGIRGSPTTEVICNDVRVPAANRLGEEGQGFPLALRALDHSRVTIGAQAVGIAQGALDHALGYTQEREQFGQGRPRGPRPHLLRRRLQVLRLRHGHAGHHRRGAAARWIWVHKRFPPRADDEGRKNYPNIRGDESDLKSGYCPTAPPKEWMTQGTY
jgi:alkylation response protein AidB-like acyl-CoA dehydrogenase